MKIIETLNNQLICERRTLRDMKSKLIVTLPNQSKWEIVEVMVDSPAYPAGTELMIMTQIEPAFVNANQFLVNMAAVLARVELEDGEAIENL